MRFIGGPTDKNYERRFKNPDKRRRKRKDSEAYEDNLLEKGMTKTQFERQKTRKGTLKDMKTLLKSPTKVEKDIEQKNFTEAATSVTKRKT